LCSLAAPISLAKAASLITDLAIEPTMDDVSVPCVYCRKPIPAESFASWSSATLLISAPCPDCHRRVALTQAGIQHEFISTWWPSAGEDSAAFARPSAEAEPDQTNGLLAGAMATLGDLHPGESIFDIRGLAFTDAGLGCLVDFGNQLGCWPRE
jgi:hypothetical protein